MRPETVFSRGGAVVGGGEEVLIGLVLGQPQVVPDLVPEGHQLRVVVEEVDLLPPHVVVGLPALRPEHKVGKGLADVLRGVGGGVGGDEVVIVPQEEIVGIPAGETVVQVVRPVGLVEVVDVGAGVGHHAVLVVGVHGLAGGVGHLAAVEGQVVAVLVEDGLHKVAPVSCVGGVHRDLPGVPGVVHGLDPGHCLLGAVGEEGEPLEVGKGPLR